MQKSILKISLTLVLISGVAPAQASFNVRHNSARSAALGNSFMGASNESAAIFTNPAGIAQLKTGEVSFLYGKPYAGMEGVNMALGHAALALPSKFGHFGVGYAGFQAPGLLQERTLVASYGTSLFNKAQVGLTMKQLSLSYMAGGDALAANDDVFKNGMGKSALTFDVGVMAPVGKYLKAGLAVRNLTEPDMGLASEDKVAREIQGGLSLEMAGRGLKISGDMALRADDAVGKTEPIPFMGLEKMLYKNTMALRVGANTYEYTGGFGLKIGAVGFDYAMVFSRNLLDDNMGSHKLGMTYHFGVKGK